MVAMEMEKIVPVIENRVLNVELFERCINFAIESWNLYMKGKDQEDLEIAWNQGDWASVLGDPSEKEMNECSSTFCIAGAAWYFSGLVEKFLSVETNHNYCSTHEDYMASEESNWGYHVRTPECVPEVITEFQSKMVNLDKVYGPDYSGPLESTDEEDWSGGAEILLGITKDEADKLFYGGNGVEDVRRQALNIAARRGVTLNLVPIMEAA